MKNSFLLLIFLWSLTSCVEDDGFAGDSPVWGGYTEYEPLIMSRSQLETSIEVTTDRSIVQPGKIYFKDGFIYMGERFNGVHIIDNRDPSDPQPVSFIRVPGAVDMAVKDDILYVDNAVDLVALNVSDLENIQEVSRQRNVFPELTPPDLEFIPDAYQPHNRPENTVIVGWRLK